MSSCLPDACTSPLLRVEPGVVMREAGYIPNSELPRHAHPWAFVAYVVEGTVYDACEQRTTAWHTGSVGLRPAGIEHVNKYQGEGARCLLMELHEEVSPSLAVSGVGLLQPGLHESHTLVSSLARRIRAEYRHGDDLAPLAIAGLLRELIVATARSDRHEVRSGAGGCDAPSWVRRVQEQLHDESPKVPSLANLAADAGVHPSHLVRSFRRHFGCAPADYASRLRIDRACRALAVTNDAISQIAIDAGFSDQAHFTRRFRAITGTTPARYRASLR